MAMTYELFKWAMVMLLWISSNGFIAQNSSTKSSELLNQSDFVGFVLANPLVSAPQSDWRQFIYLRNVDPLKGRLVRNPRSREFPWVRADHIESSGYPTCFSGMGEYLVFLNIDKEGGKNPWSTIAAFPVEYQPDDEGRISGAVIFDKVNGKILDVGQVRLLVQAILAGEEDGQKAARVVDPLLQSAASTAAAHACVPLPHEQRIQQAGQLVSKIKQGTIRVDIEKMFPQRDGGVSAPNSTRYYLGSEVMVEVPYGQTGGMWKPQNRLNGPIRVYRSLMHLD
jgi:hypothetical protein